MNADEQGIIRKPFVKGRKFIAVDLDGTLAHYEPRQKHIGAPIPKMIERVKGWLANGDIVCILTARADGAKPEVYAAIHAWCEEHLGERLYVTAVKHRYFSEIYDDSAIRVVTNTGELA